MLVCLGCALMTLGKCKLVGWGRVVSMVSGSGLRSEDSVVEVDFGPR